MTYYIDWNRTTMPFDRILDARMFAVAKLKRYPNKNIQIYVRIDLGPYGYKSGNFIIEKSRETIRCIERYDRNDKRQKIYVSQNEEDVYGRISSPRIIDPKTGRLNGVYL